MSFFNEERLSLIERIKRVKGQDFADLALAVFRYQVTHNPLYAQFVALLGVQVADVVRITDIPFLPIQLFKRHTLQTGQWPAVETFSSSGTTGDATSRHLLRDAAFYRDNARRGFEQQYGPLSDFVVLALLPSYLERQGSSLIFMVEDFIAQSDPALGGFFLHDYDALFERIAHVAALNETRDQPKKILLMGVSFALWDLAEYAPQPLPREVIVMETGGMKGRREEITRAELHGILTRAFEVAHIHSEYGMTELLSQGYSPGEGLFYPSPTLRVLLRDITDPLHVSLTGRTAALNIIDLANIDTVSFIATEDLGRVHADGSFEVAGRLDAGDVRGCNLMVGN